VTLGRNLGLHEGRCPLCASGITHSEFENGLAIAAAHARQLDEKAVEMASLERGRTAAQGALNAAEEELNRQQTTEPLGSYRNGISTTADRHWFA
jgi:hypothetical protein